MVLNINAFVFIDAYYQMGKRFCEIINAIFIITIEATKTAQLDIPHYFCNQGAWCH